MSTKSSTPSRQAILATQRIRTLLDGPGEPKLAIRMAEIIDEEVSRKTTENAHAAAQAETIALLEECQQFIQDSARVTTIAANTCDATGATVMGNQIVFHGKAGGLLFARLRTHLAQLKEGAP